MRRAIDRSMSIALLTSSRAIRALLALVASAVTACGARTGSVDDSTTCSRTEVAAPSGWTAPTACAPPGGACPDGCFEAYAQIFDCAETCQAARPVACLPAPAVGGTRVCVVDPRTGTRYDVMVGAPDLSPPRGFRACTSEEMERSTRPLEMEVRVCEVRG